MKANTYMKIDNLKLTDIAERADVSIATVSRFLNGNTRVREPVKSRINMAIMELSSNIAEKPKIIGCILPDITNPIYPVIVKAVEKQTKARNYTLLLLDSEDNPESEARNFKKLLSFNVDGILFSPCNKDNQEIRHIMATMDIPPLVFILSSWGIEDCNLVCSDDYTGAYSAVKYLLSLGHRKIMFIKGGRNHYPEQQREAGYRKALEEQGIPLDPDLIVATSYNFDGITYQKINECIDAGKEFTAVLCCTDLIAFEVLKARNSRNLSFSVIGFDDIPFASVFDVTTVSIQTYEIGKNAFMLLENVILDKTRKEEKILLNTSLIIRNSCSLLIP
jgi:DNA-binding LacI/PurR family transcriptional regulator